MIELYNEPCLERLAKIADKSIDMVLTDPPYGTTACKWDSVIPFEPMWKELNRIIKDNGAICLFGSEPFSSLLRCSNLKMFKYDWIWNKNKASSALNCNYQPLKIHEIISVFSNASSTFSKKLTMSYFPQGTTPCNIINKRGSFISEQFHSSPNNYKNTQTKKNYPTSIISYSRDVGIHPTQKPVSLCEYLIKTYTLENETVLDFTMGSGTTGVACVNTNRSFVGIEWCPPPDEPDKYFKIAKYRIMSLVK